MRQVYIYTLSCPIAGTPKYVGKTTNLENRYKRHLMDAKRSTKTRNKSWIKSLLIRGTRPIIEVLDVVDETEWPYWERFWIAQLRSWGFVLKNETDGGESCEKTPEILAKLRAALARPEVKEKISKIRREVAIRGGFVPPSRKGKKMPDDGVRKMLLSRITKGSRRKQIHQYNNGVLVKAWGWSGEIRREHPNYSIGNIHMVCRGERQLAYGYKWAFAS